MMSYSDHCKIGKHDAFVMRLKMDEGLECDRFELDREKGRDPRYESTSTPHLRAHLISPELLNYRLMNKGKCVICLHRRDPDVNKYCQKGVKPEFIMQMKMDPNAKCDKFWTVTLRQYLVVCGGHKQLAGEVLYQEKGRCAVCVFNRALRSKGLP